MANIEITDEKLLDVETRRKLAGRVEVLDKVKQLFLLPELKMMTVEQIAEYYEVDREAIKSCYYRNKNEINTDGVEKYTAKTLLERKLQAATFVKTKYYTDIHLSEGFVLRIPNSGINLFSKRAVLRIGMLLRDSRVAREVRTQLLNTFEHSTEEQRTEDILTEQEIYLNYAKAALDGDKLLARVPNKNPSELIDSLLKDNLGYLIYQEDTIKFLQHICGLSGSEADNVRRAIGRKQRDRLEAALPSILEGYCSKSPKPRAASEREAKDFLQIIEDSASYQFG